MFPDYSSFQVHNYAELHALSHFSFLKGASDPAELVNQAYTEGYKAIAITDECSLAGVVKAHRAIREINAERQDSTQAPLKLIIGSEFSLSNGFKIVVIAPTKLAYQELSGFITLARRRSPKGEYEAHFDDLLFRLKHCLLIIIAKDSPADSGLIKTFKLQFEDRVWIGFNDTMEGNEQAIFDRFWPLSQSYNIPMLACGSVLMHQPKRKALLDILYAIDRNEAVQTLGSVLEQNEMSYVQPLGLIAQRYPAEFIRETMNVANQCTFSLDELCYEYPQELVPEKETPATYLRKLTYRGLAKRWPHGATDHIIDLIEKELALVADKQYEFFFLTVYDLCLFARKNGILYQGRGSAANSVVCYCLFITEISPDEIKVLFERFISVDRDEPPDIDVDFEHERREEVIQYIYQKYGRERAALAATVITYRTRSAIRDVGKALGLSPSLVSYLAKTVVRWDKIDDLIKRVADTGLATDAAELQMFFEMVTQIIGLPRHLSQHVGGFVIAQEQVSHLVPLENTAMPDRTIIQWDKEDLETLGLLKVDVLALGMLTALSKMLKLVNKYEPSIEQLKDIPKEDSKTYDLICAADTLGVFQIESRAQMTMLPRLQPRCFYDLVIEIAIVRPGPIQGDMVHPYLRRRQGLDEVRYETDAIREALESTLGVPIFQEQVIRLSMLAAGFTGSEAEALRRAITNWGKNSRLLTFEKKFTQGMLNNGYSEDFSRRLFSQVKGFGGYGFPESHSASFALLCYYSCYMKAHHPEAFFCALLNSQPMGFYTPSQLVQDALRHDITILPIDVQKSFWHHTLVKVNHRIEDGTPKYDKAIRLGFCLIKGMQARYSDAIIKAREKNLVNKKSAPFKSVHDLAVRTGLTDSALEILASADALRSLSGNRHEARWEASTIKRKAPLLTTAEEPLKNRKYSKCSAQAGDTLLTPAPGSEKETISDYQSFGLTLKDHPLLLLRQELPFSECKAANELITMHSGSFVRVAGLVTCRQRPGTARGTMFLTLEDETGNMNVVVWKTLQERFRSIVLNAQLVLIKGHLEIADGVVHLIAGTLEDHSSRLSEFNTPSRNFH